MSNYPWPWPSASASSPFTAPHPQPRPFRTILVELMKQSGITATALAHRTDVDRTMIAKIGTMRQADSDRRAKVIPVPGELLEKIIKVLHPSPRDAAELRMAALLIERPEALEIVQGYLVATRTAPALTSAGQVTLHRAVTWGPVVAGAIVTSAEEEVLQ